MYAQHLTEHAMSQHIPTHEAASLSSSEEVTAQELIKQALKVPGLPETMSEHNIPLSYRDESPPRPTGAAPEPQPDARRVPQWATGVAVAGTGIGVMSVGLGLSAKLVFDSVTTEGVVLVSVVVGGAVVFVGALTRLAARLKEALAETPAPVTNHFHGDVRVEKKTLVETEVRALSFGRVNVNDGEVQ